MWETYNCLIPEGCIIDYVNNNKIGNRLKKLHLITQQQNCHKYYNDHYQKRSKKSEQ